MSIDRFSWWSNLRHGGLLLDTPRLTALISTDPADLSAYSQDRLRRLRVQFQDDATAHRGELVSFVLESICGFARPLGEWYRGAEVKTQWSRKAITGESIRPRHLWIGKNGATLPVFVDDQHRIGVGKGRRVVSHVLGWLRQGKEQLALITNGQEWRLVFAGLDYEAFCQWDADSWFAEGSASPELGGFRALVSPDLWTPAKEGEACPLLAAINNSRKGQADLSQILGERVRQAAELLIQAHTPALKEHIDNLASQDIYRAAVRMIMRLVVVLFAESREGLLARDNPVFHSAYSLQGLREQLERISQYKLVSGVGAYPRILGLLQLIYQGSSHPALPVPAYGGELFAPGRADDADGMKRALHLFETACFGEHQAVVMTDFHVRQILELLTRTKVKIRQGRATLLVPAPVDFSSLDSEYIGILYEGLLDFELRCAVQDEPIAFLAVGNQPALPLATLVQMDDRAIKNLLEKLKDTSSGGDDEESADGEADDADEQEDAAEQEETAESDEIAEDETSEALDTPATDEQPDAEPTADDPRFSLKMRAEEWARRACQVGNLVTRPRGRATPESQLQYERALASKARQLVVKVVLPGEWYLVRWGGTRKGAGTFYTRPQLAIPTVHRTLRPLAYDPPLGTDGQPDLAAPAETWTPKKPEAILRLKICDPACGSGSFPLSALRFLTNALYESLVVHGRIRDHGGRAVLDLIYDEETQATLSSEALPCRPDDDEFEPRTRAILRRYIVERCIYGVDLDPLAVELCRLSLWIETLDRSLPLTFLNHKIKCGNSLVGAWFDQFLHYPVMAWEREGGDKNHTNGVHLPKEGWTRAIKAFKARIKPDLIAFIDGRRLIYSVDLTTVRTGHDAAEAALAEIHNLGIAQVDQRAARYEALQASPEFQQLKAAFDLWCSLWFWPADELDHAPLPTQFAAGEIDDEGREVARRVAQQQRFFHWELEFPDVFNASSHGFAAVLGNPPWDVAKPNSKEFFSALDPLYRSYGKQEAIGKQREFFNRAPESERRWLEYNANFKATSNWVKYAGFPFGDRVRWKVDPETGERTPYHDFNLGDRGRSSFTSSERRHARWKQKREESSGYVDVDHAFRHQGSADINLYKLFLEQAHSLLSSNGRLGMIVPSGLYSDDGCGQLRTLFVDHCNWEWIFSFTNTQKIGGKIFDIHPSYKFNPVIVAKGGQTTAIRTAFMRRDLADWEQGEKFATEYMRTQIVQFSPVSRAILEIQSQRDLEVLTKIYFNSVLLGDQSERGWGIQYAREFDMTNDSKLFPPRSKWETWGYRPDEYSRWIKGPWQPIEQLYAELRLRPPVAGERRSAQPPYDKLLLPRADIPEGIIVSREADAWIREEEIPQEIFTDASGRPLTTTFRNDEGDEEEIEITGPAIAMPLYQGIMMNQLIANRAAFGLRSANKWALLDEFSSCIMPKFAVGRAVAIDHSPGCLNPKYLVRTIARTTDTRTIIGTPAFGLPAGNSVLVLSMPSSTLGIWSLGGLLSSFVYDWQMRKRIAGTNVNQFFLLESAVARQAQAGAMLALTSVSAAAPSWNVADTWLRLEQATEGINRHALQRRWAIKHAKRIEATVTTNAMSFAILGASDADVRTILADCDLPQQTLRSSSRDLDLVGFWRVDKKMVPEHRSTVLSLVAFHDLQEKITACGGDVGQGIEAFCNQNDGEGWILPETLRLADYGLGHDDRAEQHQPVRESFGPRFYDWQLAQSAEESWRECHLHARNLLGAEGYQALLEELEGRAPPVAPLPTNTTGSKKNDVSGQRKLFETEDLPLFPE
jgi:hypothetical protein